MLVNSPRKYVYPVIRTYSTGTSYVEIVFSSSKKASDHIERILQEEEKHGWSISRGWSHTHRDFYPIHRMEKGDPRNAEMYHFEKHEVF